MTNEEKILLEFQMFYQEDLEKAKKDFEVRKEELKNENKVKISKRIWDIKYTITDVTPEGYGN